MGAPKNNTLTARDLEVAGKVWQCFKTEPQVDFVKLAEVAGFKNPASASACWGPIKKKLMAQGGDGGSVPSTPASGRKNNTKRVRPTNDDADDDEESPSRKAKANKKAKKAVSSSTPRGGRGGGARVKNEEQETDDEDEETTVIKAEDTGADADDEGDAAAMAELSYFAGSEEV